MENENVILEVLEGEDNSYSVHARQDTSVAEIIFCLSVVGRCLIKDGYIDNPVVLEALFHKYLTDEEYGEVSYKESEE